MRWSSQGGATIHYVEHGSGVPVVALHGVGVDHREVEAPLEGILPTTGYRRIYPDLPGMGASTAEDLRSNDDVVTLLDGFLEHLSDPALVIGHSYGAYLARGLAVRRPDRVLGLALVCPVGERSQKIPEPSVVREDPDAYDKLEPAQRDGFKDYFVVRTRATARRYRDSVLPGTTLVDQSALARVFSGWKLDLGPDLFAPPVLIVAGRRDSVVGYRDAVTLLEHYPHASLAVLEDAGHALLHERPQTLAALVADWLERARAHGNR